VGWAATLSEARNRLRPVVIDPIRGVISPVHDLPSSKSGRTGCVPPGPRNTDSAALPSHAAHHMTSVTTVSGLLAPAEAELRKLWRRVLREGVYAGRQAAWPKKPREEDIVLGVVLAAPSPIDTALRRLLVSHGAAVAVTGVFCHGTPTYVEFDDPSTAVRASCELGDLLFVVHYRTDAGDTLNALLLQAKKDRGAPDETDDQWTLYNAWPPFRWMSAPHHVRRSRPSAPHDGAKYAMLWSSARTAPRAHAAHVAVPGRPLHHELTDMLLLRAGRGFKSREWARAEGGGGWSEVIWDILDDVAIKIGTRNGTTSGRSAGTMLVRPASGGGIPSPLLDQSIVGKQPSFGKLAAQTVVTGEGSFDREGPLWLYAERDDEPPRFLPATSSDGEGAGVSAVVIEVDVRSPAPREHN
jgi:hypothetical protein